MSDHSVIMWVLLLLLGLGLCVPTRNRKEESVTTLLGDLNLQEYDEAFKDEDIEQ